MAVLVIPEGFFSIVEVDPKRDSFPPGSMVVRATVRQDLDRLRELIPTLGTTVSTPERDYPFRACVARQALAEGVARLVLDGITYHSFKDRVRATSGDTRALVYGEVAQYLAEAMAVVAEREAPPLPPTKFVPPPGSKRKSRHGHA